MATVVVDANVIIGFLTATDPQHSEAVQGLAPWLNSTSRVLIAASAYAGILVRPMQLDRSHYIDDFIRDARIEVVPIDRAIAHRAATLRAQYSGLRLPDALALGTAIEHEAEFLTLDRRLDRVRQDVVWDVDTRA